MVANPVRYIAITIGHHTFIILKKFLFYRNYCLFCYCVFLTFFYKIYRKILLYLQYFYCHFYFLISYELYQFITVLFFSNLFNSISNSFIVVYNILVISYFQFYSLFNYHACSHLKFQLFKNFDNLRQFKFILNFYQYIY